MSQQLSNMLVIATTRHDGQFDKGGKPYILHPLKVMHMLRTEDEELQCIALGHDLIEDTFGESPEAITDGIKFLFARGFSSRIVEGIVAMTKCDGQLFDSYKEQVKRSPDAILVKMQDLRHNSDIRRLKGVGPKDVARIERYHRFYMELKEIK